MLNRMDDLQLTGQDWEIHDRRTSARSCSTPDVLISVLRHVKIDDDVCMVNPSIEIEDTGRHDSDPIRKLLKLFVLRIARLLHQQQGELDRGRHSQCIAKPDSALLRAHTHHDLVVLRIEPELVQVEVEERALLLLLDHGELVYPSAVCWSWCCSHSISAGLWLIWWR